ncbi:TetR/AcrR family transcriptional regulator [Deinococcus aestuarii]|uniref:TetR/AcrR family transcriptional regulator n=1 Tax=Deinococcus aestuarii TaxID=2774531 RepID=UPI001C0BF0D9|nr:TetR/AcrR family transcriptional regulator [Deinococcus aestuarii]
MTASPRPAGRPLDTGVRAALLRATQDLLIEEGYERLTCDAVARRCGSSKATIYRRWPGKLALVIAAAQELFPVPEIPDTGDLREDLLACGRAYLQEDGRSQQVLTSLHTAARHDLELRSAARAALGSPVDRLFSDVLTRAAARGLVPAGVDLGILAEVFPGIAFHRAAALGLPVDDPLILRVVDQVLLPALRHA